MSLRDSRSGQLANAVKNTLSGGGSEVAMLIPGFMTNWVRFRRRGEVQLIGYLCRRRTEDRGIGEVGYHGSCGADKSTVCRRSRVDMLVAIWRTGTTLHLNSRGDPRNIRE